MAASDTALASGMRASEAAEWTRREILSRAAYELENFGIEISGQNKPPDVTVIKTCLLPLDTLNDTSANRSERHGCGMEAHLDLLSSVHGRSQWESVLGSVVRQIVTFAIADNELLEEGHPMKNRIYGLEILCEDGPIPRVLWFTVNFYCGRCEEPDTFLGTTEEVIGWTRQQLVARFTTRLAAAGIIMIEYGCSLDNTREHGRGRRGDIAPLHTEKGRRLWMNRMDQIIDTLISEAKEQNASLAEGHPMKDQIVRPHFQVSRPTMGNGIFFYINFYCGK
jgi:hypothetical protein